MKRFLVILLLLVAVSSVLTAQPRSLFELKLTGGVSYFVSPQELSDYWKWGFNGGVGFSYYLSSRLGISLIVDYSSFSFDAYEYKVKSGWMDRPDIHVEGKSTEMYTTGFNVSYALFQNFDLYVLAGAGYLYMPTREIRIREFDLDGETIIPWTRESTVVINAGAGISIPGDKFPVLFFEPRYAIGFTDDDLTHYFLLIIGLRYGIIGR